MPRSPMTQHASGRPFADRHLGPIGPDADALLAALGQSDLDGLLAAALPPGIAGDHVPQLPLPASETETLAALRALASRNQLVRPLIGTGYAPAITPSVLLRGVLENPAWYTAYTPYQPEISQGRLEALLTFQTMVCDLTGLDVANASLLDEGTAAAEAMALARRVVRSPASTFLLDVDAHPQTIDVVTTRAEAAGVKAVVADLTDPGLDLADVFGVLAQYPGSSGRIVDLAPIAERVHAAGGLVVVAADPLALTLLTSPGELGADVAVGSTQRFGLPLWFGGPHAAYMAVREQHHRQLPGRLVGSSIDSAGKPALRLALQTREQHIRREKATSNICTAQVLPAVVAAFYTQWHGAGRAEADRVRDRGPHRPARGRARLDRSHGAGRHRLRHPAHHHRRSGRRGARRRRRPGLRPAPRRRLDDRPDAGRDVRPRGRHRPAGSAGR